MADFREPEFYDNGRPALSFYCNDPKCGKEEGHSLRIVRLTSMDLNICVKSFPIQDIAGLIDAGINIYPPFGLVSDEAQTELLLSLFSKQ